MTITLSKGLRPLDSHNGASRPLDPSAKLARLATASIDRSFYFAMLKLLFNFINTKPAELLKLDGSFYTHLFTPNYNYYNTFSVKIQQICNKQSEKCAKKSPAFLRGIMVDHRGLEPRTVRL